MGCGHSGCALKDGLMGSGRPEWTVARGDPVFIGMQINGQWSVERGLWEHGCGDHCFFYDEFKKNVGIDT